MSFALGPPLTQLASNQEIFSWWDVSEFLWKKSQHKIETQVRPCFKFCYFVLLLHSWSLWRSVLTSVFQSVVATFYNSVKIYWYQGIHFLFYLLKIVSGTSLVFMIGFSNYISEERRNGMSARFTFYCIGVKKKLTDIKLRSCFGLMIP